MGFFRKKLPDPSIQRTPKVLTIHVPIYFIFNKDKKLQILEGTAPYGISTDKRITRRLLKEHRPVVCKPNPIKTALRYQQIYNDSAYQTMDKVAQEFGVSRVRIHQMINLLKLDQRIVDYIVNITEPRQNNYWTERRLRGIAQLPLDKQYLQFQKILTPKSLKNYATSKPAVCAA
jgi:hypothetical protein